MIQTTNKQVAVVRRARASQTAVTMAGLIMMIGGWLVLWYVVTFWNPLAFAAMWTGATLLMWAASGFGYPGLRRHFALALVSLPLWWWFEFVNQWTQNWHY